MYEDKGVHPETYCRDHGIKYHEISLEGYSRATHGQVRDDVRNSTRSNSGF
jgi:hypothetical protein